MDAVLIYTNKKIIINQSLRMDLICALSLLASSLFHIIWFGVPHQTDESVSAHNYLCGGVKWYWKTINSTCFGSLLHFRVCTSTHSVILRIVWVCVCVFLISISMCFLELYNIDLFVIIECVHCTAQHTV